MPIFQAKGNETQTSDPCFNLQIWSNLSLTLWFLPELCLLSPLRELIRLVPTDNPDENTLRIAFHHLSTKCDLIWKFAPGEAVRISTNVRRWAFLLLNKIRKSCTIDHSETISTSDLFLEEAEDTQYRLDMEKLYREEHMIVFNMMMSSKKTID